MSADTSIDRSINSNCPAATKVVGAILHNPAVRTTFSKRSLRPAPTELPRMMSGRKSRPLVKTSKICDGLLVEIQCRLSGGGNGRVEGTAGGKDSGG